MRSINTTIERPYSPASPNHGPRSRRARGAGGAALILALIAIMIGSSDRAPAVAQTPDSLIAYAMTDQWPERSEAAAGIFQSPIDLELAADGTVLVADKGIGGVHRLLPSGVFTTPFGTTGGLPAQLAEVGQMSLGPDPAGAGELVYVIDSSADRLVIYDTDGAYQRHWEDIRARSVAASADGRVYVLDTEASAVRALSASDGSELFRFGERGTEDGQFTNFIDVDISADGRVLAVADQNTLRVQLFDLATDAEIAGGADGMRVRDVHNLTLGRFSDREGSICRASRINAMGGDRIFVGQGEQACLIEGREVLAAIATTANQGTICRAGVRLPRLRPDGAQFFALATYDPNAGPCTSKRGELDTHDVIVRYNDERLRAVRTVWDAAGEDDVTDRLFAPAGADDSGRRPGLRSRQFTLYALLQLGRRSTDQHIARHIGQGSGHRIRGYLPRSGSRFRNAWRSLRTVFQIPERQRRLDG